MKKKIILLVPDISDARVIKRIKAFQLLGVDLIICGFQRIRYNSDMSIYEHIQLIKLGKSIEKNYFKRTIRLFRGILIILLNLNEFKNSNCIYCINMDMLLLGLVLKIRYNINLFYEVGDILNAFLGKNIQNILLRQLEHILLIYTNLVILTSPAFYKYYYKPVHKLKSPWLLLENKLLPESKPYLKQVKNKKTNRIKIVYHGVLRCQQSIDALLKIAVKYSDKCDLHIHGFPLWVRHDELEQSAKAYVNIYWHGEYNYPNDLKRILSDADLLWLIDLSENQNNAKWLLPNRLYDGIYYRVPMLAEKGTETGTYIEKKNMGWCLGKNIYRDLRSLIKNINIDEIITKKIVLNKQPNFTSCSLEQYKKIYDCI